MKKTLIIFFFILIGVFVGLSLADHKSEYIAEKNLWKINKKFNSVTRDTENIPENSLNQLLSDYEKFIIKFPNSNLLSQAHIFVGRLYVYKKDIESAREKFEETIRIFNSIPIVVVKALKEIIHTYKLENDVPNVIKSYERVMKDYPLTSLGLEAPLRIVKLNQKLNSPQAQKSFNAAITHYKGLIQSYPDSLIEYKVQQLLATIYLTKQEWKKAVNTYGEVLIRFSEPHYLTPAKADALTKSINTLAVFQLNDFDLPVSIYKKFLIAHPNHPFSQRLKEIIIELGKMKEQSSTDAVTK
ncbi:hypothetical protein MNBD_UNCLBAC01-827 [hydrothermal vent metagenome]|uniref:Outer membrane lipoprotein BamD-like domain-containing protein n=1 Tax=hydrothermal vent metagenome TaxID=652676 RepID=A0A3B1DEY7_9ZZZZ